MNSTFAVVTFWRPIARYLHGVGDGQHDAVRWMWRTGVNNFNELSILTNIITLTTLFYFYSGGVQSIVGSVLIKSLSQRWFLKQLLRFACYYGLSTPRQSDQAWATITLQRRHPGIQEGICAIFRCQRPIEGSSQRIHHTIKGWLKAQNIGEARYQLLLEIPHTFRLMRIL